MDFDITVKSEREIERDPRYDILFEPVKIGPLVAKNRFYQVPHCNGAGYRYPNTVASMRGTKAEGGWAVVCTEFCSVHPSGDPSPTGHARLWNDDDIAANALMVDAVHKHGSLAGCETVLTGAYSHNRDSREIAYSPSPRPSPLGDFPSHSRAMSKSDIKELRLWHRQGVRRAKQAGFDLVYLYVAHGVSILHDFLSPRINQRTDEYGGSLENRTRLIREILEETREEVGSQCAVAIRYSLDDAVADHGMGREEARDAMELLAELPDLWDLTVGYIDWPTSRFAQENWMEPWLEHVRKVSTKPVVSVGRLTSPDTMVSLVKRGLVDFIGAARPSIADPFLPNKIKEGRPEDIRECIGCNICIASQFMVTPARCTQNPTMMEEWRRGWHPEKLNISRSQSSVLVVGSGPAGLEAAHALGKRGYTVALAESSRDLGGHLLKVTRLPGLGEWIRVRDYRLTQLNKLPNVELYPESDLTAEQILEFGYDHVALATGAHWRHDGVGRRHARPIPRNDHSIVLSPDDVMNGQVIDGPIVIFDDDHYFMGGALAELLAKQGRAVTLVTTTALASSWTVYTGDQAFIQERLLKLGVVIVANTDIIAIDGAHVTCECVFTGRQTQIEARSFIPVTSRVCNDNLYNELAGPEDALPAGLKSLVRIGDCLSPATIAQSIYSGHKYARQLEESPDSIVARRELQMIDG